MFWGALLLLDVVAMVFCALCVALGFIGGWSALSVSLYFVGVGVTVALSVPISSRYIQGR